MKKQNWNKKTIDAIIRRAHYLAVEMIHIANTRDNKEKGDPKIGGHPAASASSIHLLGVIHLLLRTGFDHIANKPHASPADHAYNYLMNLFLHQDLSRFSLEDANKAMHGLRAFSHNGEPVFQSYHSAFDPDNHNYFPSGTVGIPPVNAGYMALAYRYAKQHGYEVPDAHFWCICGDSEFREGSLHEAIPDFAERELGNLTWIIDYNRQSLDGHRITNNKVTGTDDQRIKHTLIANGWEVIEARHGKKRLAFFERDGGKDFRDWLENGLSDYELQAILLAKEPKRLREFLFDEHGKQVKNLEKFLKTIKDQELMDMIHDFGGHDVETLYDALAASKLSKSKPTMVIAHTIKGWGLDMAAASGNHSALPEDAEILSLRERNKITAGINFERLDPKSEEGKFVQARGEELYKEILAQNALKDKNKNLFVKMANEFGEIPDSLEVNYKMANFPHTQWMLGQLTAKLIRIANTANDSKDPKSKPLTDFEKKWKLASEVLVTMAPDVGTSTNLNPAMDGKIFGADVTEDFEAELEVKDKGLPDLVPGQEASDRFLRFDIAEGNVMSCLGSFGRMRDHLGVPLLPLMTVYDFFIKRALDQYFYDLYWKSSFILVGTPSGVTLSPEGAQHGWKSDLQIPNQITWEPFFVAELDWILCDAIRRHLTYDNVGRSGVLIRGVTRGADQKEFLKNLKTQSRFKTSQEQPLCHLQYPLDGGVDETQVESMADEQILATIKAEVLQGAYKLISYEGYKGYEPGDNVVNIFAMGSLTTEAIKASHALLAQGVYANVIVVTSPDLLCGIQGHENNYDYLKNHLGISAKLYLQPSMNGHLQTAELVTLSGRRIPIVSVHDGEAGLLDNLGSIIGVKQETLAVRKHSKCGRPTDVYAYHHIDSASVVEAAQKALAETALEAVQVSPRIVEETQSIVNSNQTSAVDESVRGRH